MPEANLLTSVAEDLNSRLSWKKIQVVVGAELKPKIPGWESNGLTMSNAASKQVGITADMA